MEIEYLWISSISMGRYSLVTYLVIDGVHRRYETHVLPCDDPDPYDGVPISANDNAEDLELAA